MQFISSLDFSDGAVVNKKMAVSIGDTRDVGLIPVSGRCCGVGNVNLFQYSCLENPWMRILVGYTPQSHKELDTTE